MRAFGALRANRALWPFWPFGSHGATRAFRAFDSVAALWAGCAFYAAFVEKHAIVVCDIQFAHDHPGIAGVAPGGERNKFFVAVVCAQEVDSLACGAGRALRAGWAAWALDAARAFGSGRAARALRAWIALDALDTLQALRAHRAKFAANFALWDPIAMDVHYIQRLADHPGVACNAAGLCSFEFLKAAKSAYEVYA